MTELNIRFLGALSSSLLGSVITFSPKIEGAVKREGVSSILGTFALFSYTRESQTQDIFLFIPNKEGGFLYYQFNNGIKVRSSFITFIILVLKEIGCGKRCRDLENKGVLYPARCLDPSSSERLSLFFDLKFIPYLRRDVKGLEDIRKVLDESDPWRDGKNMFSVNASNSIEAYCSKKSGLSLNPFQIQKRLFSTQRPDSLDPGVGERVEVLVDSDTCQEVVPREVALQEVVVQQGVSSKVDVKDAQEELEKAKVKLEEIKRLYISGPLRIVLNSSGLLATEVEEGSSPDLVLAGLKETFKSLCKISPKGYLNHLDLEKFPVLNEIWGSFVKDEAKVMAREDARYKRVELYRWVFNIIVLSLYERSLLLSEEVVASSDISSDIKVFSSKMSKHLDSVIKTKLAKRGIGIYRNTYTGYDSEYKPLDGKDINKLLTVQLAINGQLVVKIPCKSEFVLSSINAETGEIYNRVLEITDKSETGDEIINLIKVDAIEKSINRLIDSIRSLKYTGYDKYMDMLIEKMCKSKTESVSDVGCDEGGGRIEGGVKDVDKVSVGSPISSSLVKNGYYYVYMRRSAAVKHIYDDIMGGGVGFSLSNLIRESMLRSEDDLDRYEIALRAYLGRVAEESMGKGSSGLLDFTINNVESDIIDDSDTEETDDSTVSEGVNESKVERADAILDIVTGERAMDDDDEGGKKPKSNSARTCMRRGPDKVSISVYKSIYVLCHYTNADLCMLSDFNKFKDNLSKVGKSLITGGRPFVYDGWTVHVRDTMLLSPAQGSSLAALAALYGEKKVEIPKDSLLDMERFREENTNLFYTYGIQDALIALLHGCEMEDFYRTIGEPGFPLTLSGIGQKYVLGAWNRMGYGGYQISPKILIGDAPRLLTPKGLVDGGKTGIKMPMYISNYKGGRNESFMYGVDEATHWYDYDLTSAYTTVMAAMGSPLYSKGRTMTKGELNKLSFESLVYSYTIARVEFVFPESVKFPSIPCYIDENTTVYPLAGEACLTGMEIYLAKDQGCSLNIKDVYHIPFKGGYPWLDTLNDDSMEGILPFTGVIREVQRKRKEYPKGDIKNYLYKQIGNSMYGSVVRGINDKRKVDLKTGTSKRLEPTQLSNPIMASWITAFIRSIMGECLHYIDKLGGKVVSVTTDGFITDIDNLEEKLLGVLGKNSLLKQYRLIRSVITKEPNSSGLELKHDGSGIISWKTRGQFSANSGISAMTGFQRGGRPLEVIQNLLTEAIKSEDKSIEFVMSTLRSANDIYKHGGHVTSVYKDQLFRLTFDNRRLIVSGSNGVNSELLDSKPHPNIEEALAIRTLSQVPHTLPYSRSTATRSSNKYINNTDLAVRNFIKGLYASPPKYRLENNFDGYKGLIDFVKSFDPSIKISKYSISMLRNRNTAIKAVPRNEATIKFVEHIKTRFPDFDDSNFFSAE